MSSGKKKMGTVTSEEKKKCQTKLKYLVNTHVITTKHIEQRDDILFRKAYV